MELHDYGGMKAFHEASRLLGECMQSEEALPLCDAAKRMGKGTYKIPFMSRYGPVHCYRMAMVFRTRICKLQPLKGDHGQRRKQGLRQCAGQDAGLC